MIIQMTEQEYRDKIASKFADLIEAVDPKTVTYTWNDPIYADLSYEVQDRIMEIKIKIDKGESYDDIYDERNELQDKVRKLEEKIKKMESPLYQTINDSEVNESKKKKFKLW